MINVQIFLASGSVSLCIDALVQTKKNICKHIHKVHSLKVQNYQIPNSIGANFEYDNELESNEDITLFNTGTQEDYDSVREGDGLILKRALNTYEKIKNHFGNEKVKDLGGIFYICHTLEQLDIYCEALKNSVETEHGTLNKTKINPPNALLERQGFFKTSNKKKKPKNKKYSLPQQKTERKNVLMGRNTSNLSIEE